MNIIELEKIIFDKILNEDDCGGVCAADFSGQIPEHILSSSKKIDTDEKEVKNESI